MHVYRREDTLFHVFGQDHNARRHAASFWFRQPMDVSSASIASDALIQPKRQSTSKAVEEYIQDAAVEQANTACRCIPPVPAFPPDNLLSKPRTWSASASRMRAPFALAKPSAAPSCLAGIAALALSLSLSTSTPARCQYPRSLNRESVSSWAAGNPLPHTTS